MIKFHPIKAIIFDLWGTLVSSPLAESADKIVETLNLSGKEEFWERWGTVSVKPIEKLDEVILGFCKAVKRESGFNFVKELLKDIKTKTKVFDDVILTLTFLKEKELQLGLITNTDEPSFLIAAEKLNVDRFFDVITTSFETGLLKPRPEIFSFAINELNVEPRECMMVGDNLKEDILVPKRLGMVTVLIDRKNYYKKRPQNVDFLLRNLSELLDLQLVKSIKQSKV